MNDQGLNTALKQHLHRELDGSHGSLKHAGVGEGLASLPTISGRHSVQNAVLAYMSEPESLPFIPKAEQEQSDFQEWVQAKRTVLHQMATNKPILLDFKVSLPRKGHAISLNIMNMDVVKGLCSYKRIGLPILKGDSSKDYTAIIADFDVLPNNYDSWDKFRDKLSIITMFRPAIVTSSEHNKAKVWFFIPKRVMTGIERKEYLKEIFKENIISSVLGDLWKQKGLKLNHKGKWVEIDVLDKNANTNSIITWDMLEILQTEMNRALDSFNVFSSPKTICNISETQNISTFINPFMTWKLISGPLHKDMMTLSNRKVGILRLMASSLYLSTNNEPGGGMALPCALLADYNKISKMTISRDIKELIADGFISLQTKHFFSTENPSQRRLAAKYVWGFPYMNWAKQLLSTIKTKEIPSSSISAVEALFKKGSMNEALFAYTNYFQTFEEYLEACKGHPYFGQKADHQSKALNAWNCHVENDSKKKAEQLRRIV